MTWNANGAQIHKFLATEMDFWRRAARRSKLERIRNDTIREMMEGLNKLVDDIRITQLIWYGRDTFRECRRNDCHRKSSNDFPMVEGEDVQGKVEEMQRWNILEGLWLD